MTPRTYGTGPAAYLLMSREGRVVATSDYDSLVDMLRGARCRRAGWLAVRIADGEPLARGWERIDYDKLRGADYRGREAAQS